ncbi:restriction endonuclease subunit S [Luteimonas sp BLCC-B24]|uniref:restriction endonuclease subunit S n=1 Tax=Luteimonas sp. BLCC-B24 TaxID=3025317 RepID=UPI00234DFE69|nr:restriction endonuclease subunit S [Luteimonas sp. BLCC-B24]MDC7805268.1 restriction endonuclease subunit S [Luteimonas sp. BLCC-B24]
MSLPRYAEYKDSGVDWLGEVPAHWQLAKIRAFTRFCGGGTPSRENLSYWNGDIPWVSPKDMKVERITVAAECITETGLRASTSSMVDAGSLLIVVRSGILKHTIPVAINDVPVALNQDMKALSFDERFASSEFLMRWVQGLNELLLLAWAKQGATVESIEHSYLSETVVPLPSREEQNAITAFLDRETDRIDALIAEQETLLALLAEKRQATISHAVTRGLDPNVPMKDSGIAWLGDVPANWRVAPLKHLVSFKSGGTPSKDRFDYWGGNIPWASAKDLKSDELAETTERLTKAALDAGAAMLLPAGTILVVVRGMILARTFPVTQTLVPMAINQDLKAVRPGPGIDATFLAWLLRGTANESLQRLDEAGHGTKALRMESWTCMEVPIPPEAEQRRIARFVANRIDLLDGLRNEALRAIDLLLERRSALISAAVTGQIDVRGLVDRDAA